ncbi:MAK10-like protein, partial [Tanacetum coccineum]
MGYENHIRTLGDYSKPSHEGYRNTIELPVGNNMVPLRSDTIRLVQKRDAHSTDFASNWIERLPAGSISTWEDFTTRFLAQFFPSRRTSKLRNDILMFQQDQVTRRTIDQAADGKIREKSDEESWALLEDLALYDNESWSGPRDSAKPVKAIFMPQDVPSTSDDASSSLKINGPHDTQYCMENPEQAFVQYAS